MLIDKMAACSQQSALMYRCHPRVMASPRTFAIVLCALMASVLTTYSTMPSSASGSAGTAQRSFEGSCLNSMAGSNCQT